MDVYHNGNFWGTGSTGTGFSGTGRQKTKLTALPVHQPFLWENQEFFVPALYVGKAGAVLDVCAKIPVADMAAFLKKWPKERRLSLKTPEDYEQIDADNPGSRNFLAEMSLDDIPLKLGSGSSINWYPEPVFQMGNENPAPAYDDEWQNDRAAEMLMETYGCDRESCWHFGRLNYYWNDEPVLSPHKISLELRAEQIPVTAGYFTTTISTAGELQVFAGQPVQRQASPNRPEQQHTVPEQPERQTSSNRPEQQHTAPERPERPEPPAESGAFLSENRETGKNLKTTHPISGQEYTLTLYECRQTRHSFAEIGAKDVLYPEYCHMLSYSVSPEISRDLLDIRDCAEGDHPRKAESPEESCGSRGAAAVFLAGSLTGENPLPDRRTAASSLHFEPVPEIRWRIVFQTLPKPNRKITFFV